MHDSFSFIWLQSWNKLISVSPIYSVCIRTLILLPSLSARRREVTMISSWASLSSLTNVSCLHPWPVRWAEDAYFRGLSTEGLGKTASLTHACGLSSLAGTVALHVLRTLLPRFVCKMMLLWQDLRHSGSTSLFQMQSTNKVQG